MAEPDSEVNSKNELNPSFLVGSIDDIRKHLEFCPYATCLTAYSVILDCPVLTQIKCKRWGCRHCGPRRINSLALRTRDAKANRFITLTVNSNHYDDARGAYDATRRCLSTLSRKIRTLYGDFEYLRILEVTKKGWPHYHLIARSAFIPQKWLSKAWCDLTGAFVVDVRKIDRRENVFFYVLKYLSKCKYIPWTNRRVSWTRKFFAANSRPRGFPLGLEERVYECEHPSFTIDRIWHGQKVTHFNKDVVILAADLKSACQAKEDQQLAYLTEVCDRETTERKNKESFEGLGLNAGDDGKLIDMAGISEGSPGRSRTHLFTPGLEDGPYP